MGPALNAVLPVTTLMSSAPWEDAWDRAQPRLAEIWGSLRHLTPPFPRPMRVGQLDSELLDQELVHVLQEPLQSALATMNVGRTPQSKRRI